MGIQEKEVCQSHESAAKLVLSSPDHQGQEQRFGYVTSISPKNFNDDWVLPDSLIWSSENSVLEIWNSGFQMNNGD